MAATAGERKSSPRIACPFVLRSSGVLASRDSFSSATNTLAPRLPPETPLSEKTWLAKDGWRFWISPSTVAVQYAARMPPPSASTTNNGTLLPALDRGLVPRDPRVQGRAQVRPRRALRLGQGAHGVVVVPQAEDHRRHEERGEDRQVEAHADVVERARRRDPAGRREQHDRGRAEGRRRLLHANTMRAKSTADVRIVPARSSA